MISLINGEIIEIAEKKIIINLNGIGLEIFVTLDFISKINLKQKVKIFTYLHVREDALLLFGFEKKSQKKLFIDFLKVSGVGVKLAMEIMETPLNQIQKAIMQKDLNFLSSIKGLGKKTAQKIILELSNKIELTSDNDQKQNFNKQEVFSILENLGFASIEISKKLSQIPSNIQKTEEIVRWFLKKN